MIAITLQKDQTSGKQFVVGWQFVTKNYTTKNPEIPGERMYLDEKDVPSSFYKEPYIHYLDNKKLVPSYPSSDPLSRKFN